MKQPFTIIFLVLTSLSLSSQDFEIGATAGVASYSGDLTEHFINPAEINGSGGLFGRLNVNEYLSVKAGITYGRLSGDDANNDAPALQQRNLSFRNDIVEFGIFAEVHFIELNYYYNTFTPYIFTGFTGFYNNPKVHYDGRWIDLQPLGTEGQGTTAFPERQPYGLVQFAVPFGAGVKFLVSPQTIIGLEGGIRKTFTDYIDDVSKTYPDPAVLEAENGQLAAALSHRSPENTVSGSGVRGNPKNMDTYWFAGITIAFRFGADDKYGFLRAGKQRKRPSVMAGKF